MTIADLLVLDVDTMRFVLISAIAVAAIAYGRFGTSTGGSLTAAYVTILAVGGDVTAIGALVLTAFLAHGAVRLLLVRIALPPVWVFHVLVITSVAMTAVLQATFRGLGPLSLPGGATVLLAVGSFVTPGLLAYDFAQQGHRTTLRALASATFATLLIVIPVLVMTEVVFPTPSAIAIATDGNIPAGRFWLASLAAVTLSSAIRLSFDVRAAGLIGSVFLVEFLTLEALLTVLVAAAVANALVVRIRRRLVLSPRQRFHVSLLVGAMAAWTGLYWGARLGWRPAMEANAYGVEPLIVVGLLTSDLGRGARSASRSVLAFLLNASFVWIVLTLGALGRPGLQVAAGLLLVVVPAIVLLPGARRLRVAMSNALALGEEVADTHAGVGPDGIPGPYGGTTPATAAEPTGP
jgi:hypothetical protein